MSSASRSAYRKRERPCGRCGRTLARGERHPCLLPELFALRPGDKHGVPDVEGLCRGVIDEQARKFVGRLQPADYDEALAFLLAEAWIQSEKFDERRSAHIQFRPWLFTRLRFRLIDYWRSTWGRRGQHRVVDASYVYAAENDGDDAFVDRLDEPVSEDPGDRFDDWSALVGRVLSGGDREALRALEQLGLGTEARATRRDRAAARVA